MPLPRTIWLPIVMAVAGCQPDDTARGSSPPMDFANATYTGIGEQTITLTDGEWEGEPYVADGASRPRAGLVPEFSVTGDLDFDGEDETIVLIWSSSGGSGTRDYLAVMQKAADGAPQNIATALLGDRVQLRSAKIVRGRLIVEVVQPGPEDAACCPGQKFRRTFKLQGGELSETAAEDVGRLSLADLTGVQWRLVRFDGDAYVPVGVDVTLVVAGYGISGSSGCNRYSGSVIAGAQPGMLRADGPITATQMACAAPGDEIERRYLAALQELSGYAFSAEQLVLSWAGDDGRGTLTFTYRPRVEDAPTREN